MTEFYKNRINYARIIISRKYVYTYKSWPYLSKHILKSTLHFLGATAFILM